MWNFLGWQKEVWAFFVDSVKIVLCLGKPVFVLADVRLVAYQIENLWDDTELQQRGLVVLAGVVISMNKDMVAAKKRSLYLFIRVFVFHQNLVIAVFVYFDCSAHCRNTFRVTVLRYNIVCEPCNIIYAHAQGEDWYVGKLNGAP